MLSDQGEDLLSDRSEDLVSDRSARRITAGSTGAASGHRAPYGGLTGVSGPINLRRISFR
jgi:hypothetical protein